MGNGAALSASVLAPILDSTAANVKANELVRWIHRAHSERSLRLWTGIGLLCATVLCLASFWLGRLTALQ